MKDFFRNIIKNEIKTIEGKVNLLFGLALIFGFGFIELSYNIKKFLWELLFHTKPSNNSFLLLLGIIFFLIACIVIICIADIYRKKNISH